MLTIIDNYKLIEIEKKIHRINTSDAWGVFEATVKNETVVVNVGDTVEFTTEDSGEVVKGTVTKITCKKAKTKIQMIPTGMNCETIYPVSNIVEDSLKVIKDEESEE